RHSAKTPEERALAQERALQRPGRVPWLEFDKPPRSKAHVAPLNPDPSGDSAAQGASHFLMVIMFAEGACYSLSPREGRTGREPERGAGFEIHRRHSASDSREKLLLSSTLSSISNGGEGDQSLVQTRLISWLD